MIGQKVSRIIPETKTNQESEGHLKEVLTPVFHKV